MDARFYIARDRQIDAESLANTLVNVYQSQGYQAQAIGNQDHLIVQFKKGRDFEALLGLQATLTLSLQRNAQGLVATVGQQKWIDKAAVGAIGLVFSAVLWPLAITAGAGAFRQVRLSNEIFGLLDGLVLQNYPEVQINPNIPGTPAGV